MKLYKKASGRNLEDLNQVKAATQWGTTYYEASIDQVKEVLKEKNIVLYGAIETEGFDSIWDLDIHLPGSYVQDDKIYLCGTDGEYINVDGEAVDPETAMEEFGPEMLTAYIQPADDEIISHKLTSYEITNFDMNEVAEQLMSEKYTFFEIYEAFRELED